jgi:peroxiredoxin Q/BCP
MRRLLLSVLCVTAVAATGAQAPVDLKVGDAAPGFNLPGSDGKTHTLAQYAGRTVVLAWFPAAFTGG